MDYYAERHSDSAAMYQRDPRKRSGEAQYLCLSFAELVQERDAWAQRLRESGIGPSDRAVVWLPVGLSLVAASYALMRIGADITLLEPDVGTGAGASALAEARPTVVIGMPALIAKWRRSAPGSALLLEVADPLLRLALSAAGGLPSRSESARSLSALTVVSKGADGVLRFDRFGQNELLAQIGVYRDCVGMKAMDTDAPRSAYFALLNPAMGVASAFFESGFVRSSGGAEKRWVEGMRDLGVSRLKLDAPEAWSLVEYLESQGEVVGELRSLLVAFGEGLNEELFARLRTVFPNAELSLFLGAGEAPIAAMIDYAESVELASELNEIGSCCVGMPLPGVKARIAISQDALESGGGASGEEDCARTGELFITGPSLGGGERVGEGGREETSTGYFAFEGEEGRIWLRGRVEDAVRCSFGTFVPARCEPVFLRHPQVRKALLLSIRTAKGTRPGIVVETEASDLPQGALEVSKFKAELLQLGASCPDTKLILDIFFTVSLAGRKGRRDCVDRAALSRRYSLRARLKAMF